MRAQPMLLKPKKQIMRINISPIKLGVDSKCRARKECRGEVGFGDTVQYFVKERAQFQTVDQGCTLMQAPESRLSDKRRLSLSTTMENAWVPGLPDSLIQKIEHTQIFAKDLRK